MSSGQHLSKELYDLIKSIGETRSKQEEDKIIQVDVQQLKQSISQKNIQPKKMKEYLIRAIYIEMLGHDASFAYIHSVNLCQDKNLIIKRIGYLSASLFLGPEDPLLVMIVSSLQKDLTSKNNYEVMAALTTVCKILSMSIVNALVDPVCKLLSHQSENVRKKAVMALHSILKISPSSVPELNDKIKRALCDRDPSVMAASLNLFHDFINNNPGKFKELTSSFVVILKQIIDHKLAREYDYHRIPAPWLQIKLLQILALLGANDQKASEHIYEIVSLTMKRADDTGINIGYAITFQCVKTIATIYPNQTLLEAATTSLSRFLSTEYQTNNNLKFLGISALIQIVNINPKYAVDHQMVIVDCLESKDETLKRETLDLLFKMTNSNNIEAIVSKLLVHLKQATDAHFKKELVQKITSLSERFAPGQEWYINTMSQVLEHGSEHVDSFIINNMLKLIDENFRINPDFGEFLIETYMAQVDKENLPDVLARLISWVFGEIGSFIYENDQDKLHELCTQLLKILDYSYDDDNTIKGSILTALSKLAAIPCNQMRDTILEKFEKYSCSKHLNLQHRSLEYKLLSKYGCTQNVEVDTSFSFLDKFVSDSRKRGNTKEYDPSKRTKGQLFSLTLNANTGGDTKKEEQSLKYEPYKASEQKRQSEVAGGTGIKVQDSKWSTEGYKEDKHESNLGKLPQSLSANYSKSISSSDFNSGKMGFKQEAISSKDFKGGSGPFTTTTTQTSHTPAPKPEDPNAQEKQKLASALFGAPTQGQAKKAPSYDPFNLNYKASSTTTTTKSTTNKPPTSTTQQKPQPKNEDINLLDMDFDDGSTTANTTTSQQPTGGDFDLLGGGNSAPQPSYQGKYQPFSIEVDQFEDHWNNLSQEVSNAVQTSIKNISGFKVLTQRLNIYVVAETEEDGEVLCAAKTNSGEVILVYCTVNPNGNLDLQFKASQINTVNQLAAHMKEAINQ